MQYHVVCMLKYPSTGHGGLCVCQYILLSCVSICILIMRLHHLYDFICLHEPLRLHFTNVWLCAYDLSII